MGTAPTVTAAFTDIADVATDPATIEFRTIEPNGTETPYTFPDATITNPAVGSYVFTWPTATTDPGEHWVVVSGTGNGVTVADEVGFTVHATHAA